MSEPQPAPVHTETLTSPERTLSYPPLHGLQARLALAGTDPGLLDYRTPATLTPDALSKDKQVHFKEVDQLIAGASLSERPQVAKEQLNTAVGKWCADVVRAVQSNSDFFTKTEQGKQFAEFFQKFGLNVASCTEANALEIYNQYCNGKSDYAQFEQKVFSVFSSNNQFDRAAFEANLPAIRWLANMFGQEFSADIFTQRMYEKVRRAADSSEYVAQSAPFVAESGMEQRSKDCIDFLLKHKAKAQRVEPTTPDKKSTVLHPFPHELQKIVDAQSWTEVREIWRNASYGKIYEQMLPSFNGADSTIPQTPENMSAITHQLQRANTQEAQRCFPQATVSEVEVNGKKVLSITDKKDNAVFVEDRPNYKLNIIGQREPKMTPYEDKLTRIYISLDPRKATDAFYAFLTNLADQGVLSDIQVALVTEETGNPTVEMNSLVVYVTKSQQADREKVLDTILKTYKTTREQQPELFTLEPQHRAANRANFLSSYRCFIDDTLSFSEMYSVQSYDAAGRQEIDDALGIVPYDDKSGVNHAKRLERLRTANSRVVWKKTEKPDVTKLNSYPDGKKFKVIRKLNCPGLIQYEDRVVVKRNGKFLLEPTPAEQIKISQTQHLDEISIPDVVSAIRIITQPAKPESFVPLSPEAIQLQEFINKGGKLILEKKYEEAIRYFTQAHNEAKKYGYYIASGRSYFINEPISPDEIADKADVIASWSRFSHDQKSITIGGAEGNIPSELRQEIALVAMEEWLHALQFLHNNPLAGFQDHEIDVAAYMQKMNIPVTPTFMSRYDRDVVLTGKANETGRTFELRRGRFVNVTRTDGRVEDNWQIVGFNSDENQAIVVNAAQLREKRIPIDRLLEDNQIEVLPFAQVKTLDELFQTLDSLQGLCGFQEFFTAEQLKSIITEISHNKKGLSSIPRSGGLREKVKELLKI